MDLYLIFIILGRGFNNLKKVKKKKNNEICKFWIKVKIYEIVFFFWGKFVLLMKEFNKNFWNKFRYKYVVEIGI